MEHQIDISDFDDENPSSWLSKVDEVFALNGIESNDAKHTLLMNSLPELVGEACKKLQQTAGDYSELKAILTDNSMLYFLDCDTPSTFYYRIRVLMSDKLSPANLFCHFFDMTEEDVRNTLEDCEGDLVVRLTETTLETVEDDEECLRELLQKADSIHNGTYQ